MTGVSKIADPTRFMEILKTPEEESVRTTEADVDVSAIQTVGIHPLNIGLIDCHRFSQECLIKVFYGLEPRPTIVPFETVHDFLSEEPSETDLIVYYCHSAYHSEQRIVEDVVTIRRGFRTVPIIILSDSEDAENPDTIRSVLKNGAQGFIPTRTNGLPITFAAIRFITSGGVFAPLDLLLTKRLDRAAEAGQQCRLTPRQLTVFNQLQQGKANKIIAHELGMSESTVKVHIRNIMRKTGATNRTQAAYKAQKLWGTAEIANLSSAGAY
nr:response regulator transcription factor [uncultured Rhodopila sp.]